MPREVLAMQAMARGLRGALVVSLLAAVVCGLPRAPERDVSAKDEAMDETQQQDEQQRLPGDFYSGQNVLGKPTSIALTGTESGATGSLAAGGAPTAAAVTPATPAQAASGSSPTRKASGGGTALSDVMKGLNVAGHAATLAQKSKSATAPNPSGSSLVNPQVSAGEQAVAAGNAFPGETMGELSTTVRDPAFWQPAAIEAGNAFPGETMGEPSTTSSGAGKSGAVDAGAAVSSLVAALKAAGVKTEDIDGYVKAYNATYGNPNIGGGFWGAEGASGVSPIATAGAVAGTIPSILARADSNQQSGKQAVDAGLDVAGAIADQFLGNAGIGQEFAAGIENLLNPLWGKDPLPHAVREGIDVSGMQGNVRQIGSTLQAAQSTDDIVNTLNDMFSSTPGKGLGDRHGSLLINGTAVQKADVKAAIDAALKDPTSLKMTWEQGVGRDATNAAGDTLTNVITQQLALIRAADAGDPQAKAFLKQRRTAFDQAAYDQQHQFTPGDPNANMPGPGASGAGGDDGSGDGGGSASGAPSGGDE